MKRLSAEGPNLSSMSHRKTTSTFLYAMETRKITLHHSYESSSLPFPLSENRFSQRLFPASRYSVPSALVRRWYGNMLREWIEGEKGNASAEAVIENRLNNNGLTSKWMGP